MSGPRVELCEVGPRDGLQNERRIVPVATKARFVGMLADAGVREIEVTAFVSPKWVPQLADAEELLRALPRRPGVVYSALVPNEKGLARALSCGVGKVAVFTAASETFAGRNVNATISESIERFRPVVRDAHAAGIPVRGYVSCAVACPYEGPIAPERVRETCARLLEAGVDELDLGDTIGVARPDEIARVLEACAALRPIEEIVVHLHDTQGLALACADRALTLGARRFDGSAGGIGGCPYAPGASGNVASERLVELFESRGYRAEVDREGVANAGRFIASALEKGVGGAPASAS